MLKMIKNSRIIILFFFSLIIVCFSSCDQNRYFEQNIEIQNNQWEYSDTKDFDVLINDTVSSFNFYLNLRNTNDYPYSNLYVFIETTFPDMEVARDTIELQLANVEGRWLGEGNGKFKYNNFILRKAMRFVKMGNYKFGIKHGMRNDTLLGISDVGIRLEYYP